VAAAIRALLVVLAFDFLLTEKLFTAIIFLTFRFRIVHTASLNFTLVTA
jgi:hypothetical protein